MDNNNRNGPSAAGSGAPNSQSTSPNGAIFSSGATAPAAPASTPSGPAPDLKHPFFAHHPTHTFAPNVGDIVLGGSAQPKKSKKPLIIAGVIVALLAGAGVVIAILLSGTQQERIGSLLGSFRSYANYLATGAPTTTDPTHVLSDPYSSYIVNTIQSGDEEAISSTFNEAQALLNGFAQEYQQSETTNYLVTSLIEMNQNQLSALRIYAQTEQLDSITMTFLYLNDGAESMQETVSSTYETLLSSDNTILSTLANIKLQIASNLETVLNFYQARGCITDATIQDTCVEQQILPEDIATARSYLSTLDLEAIDREKQIITNVFGGCQNLLSALTPNENNTPEDSEEMGEL